MAKTGVPRNFMEQFCSDVNPNFDTGTDCTNWFGQALDHCNDLLTGKKKAFSSIWSVLRSYIFAYSNTQVMVAPDHGYVHPNRLRVGDCNKMLLSVAKEYIVHAPSFNWESQVYLFYSQLFYATLVLVVLAALLIIGRVTYRHFNNRKPVPLTPLEMVFSVENRCLAVVKRDMRRVRYELMHLRVKQLMQPEDLLSPDGSTTLVLKVSTRVSVMKGVVATKLINSGRLYRKYEQDKKKKPEYKTETVPKILTFINSHRRKMKVILLFDETDATDEDIERRSRSISPPSHPPQSVPVAPPKSSGQRCKSQPPLNRRSLTARSTQSTRNNIRPEGGASTRSVKNAKKVKESPRMTLATPRTTAHRNTTNSPNKKPTQVHWR